MEIWPAIDLRGGKCVRLRQGDYAQETVFGDDPVAAARRWVGAGAGRLHLVDLDGAKAGSPVQLPLVAEIVAAAGVPCQLGGGVRTEGDVAAVLAAGVERAVVGTKAVRDPDWLGRVAASHPGRIVLGVDAKDGLVAAEGWVEVSQVSALELAGRCHGFPLAGLVYTDIATDGMLAGPNLAAMAEMAARSRHPVIASGGVTTADDVAALRERGLAGCIIGRSLYEGRLSLADALAAAG